MLFPGEAGSINSVYYQCPSVWPQYFLLLCFTTECFVGVCSVAYNGLTVLKVTVNSTDLKLSEGICYMFSALKNLKEKETFAK